MTPACRFRLAFVVLWATGGGASFAQSQILSAAEAKRLGAGYAAMINFAENPDIATASYYIDNPNGKDPTLSVSRYGWSHDFDLDNHAWTPFVQVRVPYLTYSAHYDLDTNGSVDTKWTAFGTILSTGVRIPVTTNLTVNPVVNAGWIRIENGAHYEGPVSALEPAFHGTILDWISDAWLAGASLWIDYSRAIGSRQLSLHAGASHNLIETFQTPSGSVDFSSYATTLSLHGEMVHPTPWTLKGDPLSVVTTLGGTTLVGPYRDELGFDYFIDAGLALEVDIARHGWKLKKLRLGAKGIYGEEVVGWSSILSWAF